MASNRIPHPLDRLFALAEDMADGLHTLGTAVGVKQNQEADVRADLAAAQAAETAFQAKRQDKDRATATLTVADSNAKAFIATAKRVLENYLGRPWSQAWATAGFPKSTAIPGSIDARQTCLGTLKTYLAANPAYQNEPLDVTPAKADAFFQAVTAARAAVNDALTKAGGAKSAHDTAEVALRNRLSGLVSELGQLLAADDPRWYAFGLSRPGDPETPGIPDGLVLTAGLAGTVLADWADARRASRYRVFKQVLGADPDFVPAATVTDSDATLTGLPSTSTVKVRVTAANDAGESQPSAEAQIVVP